MDFEKIKSDYPKAWELFLQSKKCEYIKDVRIIEGVLKAHPRDLYDFFDEQGIRINVESGIKVGPIFRCTIFASIEMSETYVLEWHNSRTEAETEAFTKAFEILDAK